MVVTSSLARPARGESGALSSAQPPSSHSVLSEFGAQNALNGVDPKQFGEFWRTWQLVTIRYRDDIKQMRFIYANPVAAVALAQNRLPYSDGAMFGKVIYETRRDSAFPASFMPGKPIRIQLMKKDARAYPATGGWGFALYTEGHVQANPLKDKTDAEACHACHAIVSDRDFVFATPYQNDVPAIPKVDDLGEGAFHQLFRKQSLASLGDFANAILKRFAAAGLKEVYVHKMPLFYGSEAESVPALSRFVVRDKAPYLLIDDVNFRFVLVTGGQLLAACPDGVFVAAAPAMEVLPGHERPVTMRTGKFCADSLTWDGGTGVLNY
jgi:hypothetical protein